MKVSMILHIPTCRWGLLFLLCVLCAGGGPTRADESFVKDGVVKPFRTVTISASIREIIREVLVEEGDVVEEGQVLVNLQSEKQEFAKERLDQMIRKADFDYNAAKRLFEQKVASRDDAFEKEVELKRLEAERQIAEAELREREIRSPLSGVVVRKYKESAESIAENDPIMQLIETHQLLFLFHLEASFLTSIQKGQKVAVRFPEMPSFPESEAMVNFIDPEVDSRSGLFRVRLLFENEEGMIRPGLRVQANFPGGQSASEDAE